MKLSSILRKNKEDKEKTQVNELEHRRARRRGLVYIAIYFSLIPTLAFAEVLDTLNNFFGYLTGDVGKAIAH